MDEEQGSAGVGSQSDSLEPRAYAMPEAHTVPLGEALATLMTIQAILWLDYDGPNPDKEWGVETIEDVAAALERIGLKPR